jgi:hypothetical protein
MWEDPITVAFLNSWLLPSVVCSKSTHFEKEEHREFSLSCLSIYGRSDEVLFHREKGGGGACGGADFNVDMLDVVIHRLL